MNRIWAGIDSGRTHCHCHLLKLVDAVLALSDQVTRAVDVAGGER